MTPLLLVGLCRGHPPPSDPLMCHGSILMAATMHPALLHWLLLLLLVLWVCKNNPRGAQQQAYKMGLTTGKEIRQRVQLRIAATPVWPRPTAVLMLLML